VITLAVLGGGFMGAAHGANYQRLGERVRVKSLYSRPSERSRKLAESLGSELVEDLDAALADVDAVDVCLPTDLHREAAEAALAAGKHVFLEKPIALTLEDADAIVAAARASGRVFMVGLVLRFWPEYVELQRLLAGGELGRPLAASTHRLSPPADWNDWMADPARSGGVAVDLLIHDFDQTNAFLGRAERVFAQAPTPSHVVAVVDYEGGARAVCEGSMAMPRSYPFSSNIRVLCDGGAAEYAFSAAPADDGGNIGEQQSARGLRLYPADGPPRTVSAPSVDPWGPELEYFVECVEAERTPERGTGEQARAALAVALAANRSLASGKPEPV
jgi:predicted dehydrogenase